MLPKFTLKFLKRFRVLHETGRINLSPPLLTSLLHTIHLHWRPVRILQPCQLRSYAFEIVLPDNIPTQTHFKQIGTLHRSRLTNVISRHTDRVSVNPSTFSPFHDAYLHLNHLVIPNTNHCLLPSSRGYIPTFQTKYLSQLSLCPPTMQ